MHTDTSYENLPNGGSKESFIILLVGENSSCNLLSWQSKKLKHVVQSLFTSETLTMLDGAEASLYTRDLFKELCGYYLSIHIYTYNESLIDAIKSVCQ